MAFFDWLSSVIPWKKTFTGEKLAGKGSGFLAALKKVIPWQTQTQPAGSGKEPPSPPSAPATHPDDWAMSGTWLHVFSSNVEAARYLWDSETLEVSFKGEDGHYQYFGVPINIATQFLTTDSPGRLVWDRLRIRGTKTGTQYPYVRLRGISHPTSRKPTVGGLLPESRGKNAPTAELPPWQGKNVPWRVKP